jgi:hypothetical protein
MANAAFLAKLEIFGNGWVSGQKNWQKTDKTLAK